MCSTCGERTQSGHTLPECTSPLGSRCPPIRCRSGTTTRNLASFCIGASIRCPDAAPQVPDIQQLLKDKGPAEMLRDNPYAEWYLNRGSCLRAAYLPPT